MKLSAQNRVLNNIVSPYGLAAVSYAFFLFSCLLPPSIYTRFMHEPDLMFLDPVAILFYTLCVSGFLAGVWLIGWLVPPAPFVDRKIYTKLPPAVFLLVPLLLCVLFTSTAIALLVKNNPLAILLLANQSGNLLAPGGDASLELHGTMTISILFVPGVIWWSVWRANQFRFPWRGQLLVKFAQLLTLVAVFIFASLILSKHEVTVIITGLAIAYLVRKTLFRNLNWGLVGKTALMFTLGGLLVFFFVTFIKGALDTETQINTFVGYTIASYNRLAALLSGALHFEYSGRGIYFSNFLSYNNLINQFIPYRKVLNIPDFYNWWGSEFEGVGRAGLNSSLIYFGTFGELFVELKWFTPLYLFLYGLLYGLIWRWMIAGRLIGIVLYPYFGYCILLWFTTNGLFDQDFFVLILDVMLLAAYEFLFVRRSGVPALTLQLA
jgi:hypothetical protein